MTEGALRGIKALAVDTGGTVLDWLPGVTRAFQEVGQRRGRDAPWTELTKHWRRLSTGMVNDGLPQKDGRVSIDFDDVLRQTLEPVLADHGLSDLPAEDRETLVRSWRRLDAWPDVVGGVARLRTRFLVAPFTILRTPLVVEASRHVGVSWDLVISCEMIGIYKTDRRAYETAAHWMDCRNQQVLLVTCHNNDLRAAHSYGLPTAFVNRPDEWGDEVSPDAEADPAANIVCDGFDDLADQLGCPAA